MFIRNRKIVLVFIVVFALFLYFWTNPNDKSIGTVKILDFNGKLLYESIGNSHGRREWVELGVIPKKIQDAVVLEEDQRFWDNSGIDILAISRAVIDNFKAGKVVSGASTITQQTVRYTVISPQKIASHGLIRKLREAVMAIRLTASLSKEKILERYLNSIYFGRNNFGVEAASQYYFGTKTNNLSVAQAALLAVMIKNPSANDPYSFPDQTMKSRNELLIRMRENRMINDEEYERAKKESLPVDFHEQEYVAPHYVEMVLQRLNELKIPIGQGLVVTTTLDKDWYNFSLETAIKQVEKVKKEHNVTNAAVVIIENQSGRVKALVGGVNYFDKKTGGQNNMALAFRQPGSALKPVTYAAAFEAKRATPATLIDDSPKQFYTRKGEGFLPHNYDNRFRGNVLAREALASSYNLPAVEILSHVGIEAFLNLSHRLGITSMTEAGKYDLALTLGGGEVNLLEITNLYATFARGGSFVESSIIEKVESETGVKLYSRPMITPKKVLDEKVAWLITSILSDKRARIPGFGYNNLLNTSFPSAVKTGTTSNWHDNWTIGYTPDYTVGVWVGNNDNEQMNKISGVTGAAPIWNEVISEINKHQDINRGFPVPEGIVKKEVCLLDGLLPNEYCDRRMLEYFIAGTEPLEESTVASKTDVKNDNVQIINPVSGSIYENSGNNKDRITFQISANSGAKSVGWVVNGSDSSCEQTSLEDCVWQAKKGLFSLAAVVRMVDGTEKRTNPVSFEVTEYNDV